MRRLDAAFLFLVLGLIAFDPGQLTGTKKLKKRRRAAALQSLAATPVKFRVSSWIVLMNKASRAVQRTYLTLLLFNTLAASLIWGINTLFLLDAGLSNTEAFAANAFFTAGLVLFEIPTGVIADLRGRKVSYLLGVLTLAISTLIYLYMWQVSAPFWAWAISSVLLGLGFTFFSGAVEAWLADALDHTGYKEKLESVLAKGEIVEGAAMLTGSVAGGFIAQMTNLGVPYLVRAGFLVLNFFFALVLMKDLGFKPATSKHPVKEIKKILSRSIEHGLRNPPVRWVMLAAPFMGGVTIYAFYAMQPYLLELYGREEAYGIAGIAAAVVAGARSPVDCSYRTSDEYLRSELRCCWRPM